MTGAELTLRSAGEIMVTVLREWLRGSAPQAIWPALAHREGDPSKSWRQRITATAGFRVQSLRNLVEPGGLAAL